MGVQEHGVRVCSASGWAFAGYDEEGEWKGKQEKPVHKTGQREAELLHKELI